MSWFAIRKKDPGPLGPCTRALLKAAGVLEMKLTREYPGFQAQAEIIAEIAERLVRLEILRRLEAPERK